MSFKLKIEFGGLCMFVEEKSDPAGLYVLMPAMGMGNDEHCPMVLTYAANTPDRQDWLYPFHHGTADLSMLRVTRPGAANRFTGFLPVSKFANKTPVAAHWLTTAPGGSLAARVRLPLWQSVNPAGNSGAIKLQNAVTPGDCAQYYGLAELTMELTDPNQTDIHIFGQLLDPRGSGVVKVTVVNVPFGYLKKPGMYRHAADAQLDHLRGYYGLLKGYAGTEPVLPTPVSCYEVGEGTPESWPCPDVPQHFTVPTRYIDPLNCTVGFGCPEDDPECSGI